MESRKEGGRERAIGRHERDSRRAKRGETAEAVHNSRTKGARARGGRGRKKLNRGLGATSEEMVGPKNWRGPGPRLSRQRGARDGKRR